MAIHTSNGVKPRYDGQGSLFGNLHRSNLDIKYGMFDIDALTAQATISLELKNEEIGFIEYRTNFDTAEVTFVALFEIKYRKPFNMDELLKCKIGTATFAQKQMCKKLGMRYFFVIQTEGELPFHFVEVIDKGYKYKGELRAATEMKYFWDNILELN